MPVEAGPISKFRHRDSSTSDETQAKTEVDNDVFKTVADNAPIMLWMTDAVGAPVFFNQRWLSFTGLEAERALGDAWVHVLHPDDRARCLSEYSKALNGYRSLRLEYRLLRYDGVYRHMLDIGDPRHDEAGRFAGFVGCTVDITDQKEIQLELKDSHSTLAERSREITLLNELNDNLQVCKDIDETRIILDRFGRLLFPGLSGTICLYKPSRNIVEPFAGWGDDQHLLHPFKPDNCWALRKGKVHCEFETDEGFICPNTGGACSGRGYACVPMVAYGEVIGVMHMGLPQANVGSLDIDWSDSNTSTRRLMSMSADQVALALANLKLRETLHYQSTRDPLTSLCNRRYFADCLEREVARSDANDSPLALLMIDIDQFKRYNDTHGHDAGDHVLRAVASQLQNTLRKDDVVCRYGGEEFAILLTDLDEKTVVERTEFLRRQIGGMEVAFRGQSLPAVALSVGIAFYPANGNTGKHLIESADRALYVAKENGRDQIVLATSIPIST